ncbi:MAG: Rho termination factor N-terminal domain-containing protein [Bacteriovoracaceae bacterium]|nr:Rho termination factor N-terminal domain-containing protein [Bacteriovoracaceae bacterium]
MPNKSPGPQVKDKEVYEKVKKSGASKEKAARIANAAAKTSRSAIGKKGGKHSKYEEWKVDELKQRAREIGIEGRSKMNKGELIDEIRNH